MKHLFLIRHARAKRAETANDDHERPLSGRGQRQVAAMAEPLHRLGAFAGEIHVSTATRARQTLLGLDAELPELGLASRAQYHEALYTFEEKPLRLWLKAADLDTDHLALIGHNPALLALAQRLSPQASKRLPTGSLLHIALPIATWRELGRHTGEVAHFLSPRVASHTLFQRKAPEPPRLDDLGTRHRIINQLEHQYRMIRALEPGVAAGHDPEFLHQYRVNLRRSRALAETLLAIIEIPRLGRALKGLKRRTRATSELRDLEVFLEPLTRQPPPEAGAALTPLIAWLHERIREARRELCHQLQRRAYARDMLEWRDTIASKGFAKALSGLQERQIDRVLRERLARHDAQLVSLTDASPDAALHKLRKRVKRIRYLAELSPERHRRLLENLKPRQERLGDFQDLCTRLDWLDAFTASAPSQDLPDASRQAVDRWLARLHECKAERRQAILTLEPLIERDSARLTT
ncbi:CHAD domain-containing protein [Halomonas sp. EGI 63088]|uniref:CHAD domain-containing protein n=1 Tax=Halomonas flagellata TaxID=2920385 RepID=A0ABS9RY92_9GAMM|nr:CHAD domain-containing protein [Halomonas flagellata]MCH4564803.1 CHAD domain-containing protein [Halomonas flagellata]